MTTHEKILEYHRKYNASHKEQIKAYRIAHREEILAKQRAKHIENHEKDLARGRAYEVSHHEKRVAYTAAHKEDRATYNKIRNAAIRQEVLDHYGNKCVCCGETTPEFLAIDHINGGGNKHRKEVGGSGPVMYRWLKKNNYPEGFQILCHNCNMAKGFYGACPHLKFYLMELYHDHEKQTHDCVS